MRHQSRCAVTALLFLLGLAVAASQGRAMEKNAQGKASAPSGTVSAAAEANDLGARLLPRLLAGEPGRNVVISPFSLALALQLAADGARGKTEAGFRQALGLGAKPMPAASAELGALAQKLLGKDAATTFTLANGVWASPAAGLHASFAAAAQQTFQAEINSLDFANPGAYAIVNRWVAAKTQGLIPDMLGPLPRDTRLVIANALYLKGRWQRAFDVKRTTMQRFAVAGAATAPDVPMMHAGPEWFGYRETSAFQAVILPFVAGRFDAVILLPTGPDAVAWAKVQDAEAWRALLRPASFDAREGYVALPRLDVATTPQVQAAIAALGLEGAFTRDADFSGLASERVWLSRIAHKTVLKLVEEGVEAGAATTMTMPMARAAPRETPPPPFHMVVDRPFVFVLRHAESGAIVLQGVINDPGARAVAVSAPAAPTLAAPAR